MYNACYMSRTITYNLSKLPALKKQLELTNEKFKLLGYGSKARVARWLIENNYQAGTVEQVAKKISHLLTGYVRGIHPKLRSGGVWRPEEAERILALVLVWLKSELVTEKKQKRQERQKPIIKPEDDEF